MRKGWRGVFHCCRRLRISVCNLSTLPTSYFPFRLLTGYHAAHAQPSTLPKVTYHGVIQVFSLGGTSLGYVQTDPNYWTPFLTPDITTAQVIEFALDAGATSGTQLDLQQLVSFSFLRPHLSLVILYRTRLLRYLAWWRAAILPVPILHLAVSSMSLFCL